MVTASKQTASTTADIKSQFIIFPDCMHVADPHTCSGYATANPEIGNKDNCDVEQLDGDVYALAPNGDMVIKADVPKTKS